MMVRQKSRMNLFKILISLFSYSKSRLKILYHLNSKCVLWPRFPVHLVERLSYHCILGPSRKLQETSSFLVGYCHFPSDKCGGSWEDDELVNIEFQLACCFYEENFSDGVSKKN